jgi:hypothetical protein
MYKSKFKKASSRITRRSKNKQLFSLFLKVSLPTAVLVGLFFLARADFLQVKNFEIVGAEKLSQEEIQNVAKNVTSGNKFLFIPKSNIFIINKNELAGALVSQFGRLDKVEINKEFFNKKVKLTVVERTSDFLWCASQDECFFMNKNGLVFEKALGVGDSIIFKGILEGNPLMKNFATPEKMQNYLSFIEVFKNAKFEISSVNIESADKGIATSNIGDIFFNPEEKDLHLAAQNAILLINDVKAKNPSTKFNYIDARFGNKIYYKLY